ncbi:MAG: LPS translocon maturation chaperone LptM [Rhodoplanes sp.]|jgi:predicted small lipoprotein YifL|nr:lipoprotein [Rhodoplanes sp.]
MRRGDRWFAHVLLVLWLFVALGLAGCGRKSDLDPPSASAAAPAAVEPTGQPAWRVAPTQPAPPPPPPRDRRFLLDPLLN